MIEIQKMTAASAKAAAELEAICFASPWSEDALLQMSENPNASFLCAFSDGVFAGYNDLQKSQGLDLAPLSGKRVRKTVFTVTNYEGYEGEVTATLFVYKNRVVAGDLSSGDPNGFTCGFDGESG